MKRTLSQNPDVSTWLSWFGSCIMDGFQYTIIHPSFEMQSKSCS